jgi:hypothetical protein
VQNLVGLAARVIGPSLKEVSVHAGLEHRPRNVLVRSSVRLDFNGEDLASAGHRKHITFVAQLRRLGLPPCGRVRPVQGIQPSGGQLAFAGILLRLRTEGHDCLAVDHAADIAPGGRDDALAVLAAGFGGRTAALVAAVTNPDYQPGRDEHQQYREHVTASLEASPWARVIKASDFTDNAIGVIHLTGPKLSRLARKYGPLVPVLRELILRPDTPLDADVKTMIAAQLDTAQGRFAAIWHIPDADGPQQPP